MKNQLHAYADEELYRHCALLAEELGLSNSSYIKMLVGKAWIERKGGDTGKNVEKQAELIVQSGRAGKTARLRIGKGSHNLKPNKE